MHAYMTTLRLLFHKIPSTPLSLFRRLINMPKTPYRTPAGAQGTFVADDLGSSRPRRLRVAPRTCACSKLEEGSITGKDLVHEVAPYVRDGLTGETWMSR